ncbi:MAG TPA: FAD-dependent oxidoreductase [Candidatus Paceibacterota bacterium]|nr:FAD-dependent oxidoreductase [Verrucomicrobiota bacterium]HSA11990.1 FAD-dependent oxidoreductase [Candidatus Paceibacterota bacterium]
MKQFSRLPRRSFIKGLGLTVPVIMGGPGLALAQSNAASVLPARATKGFADEPQADLIIIGGGLGGCAAALAAARNGLRVIMTEETDWIGGQLTAQAVPPDENPWIETFGGTRSYLNLRAQIRDYYLRHFPLTAAARANSYLNPGNGWVSRLCHEPRVALAVLNQLLAPFVSGQRVLVLLRHKPVGASTSGDRIQAVQVRSLETGNEALLRAPFFVDATELGDLLPLTKTEYVTGAESQKDTGEPHAPAEPEPNNMQAFTCCFAMDYLAGEDHTIEKPREYGFWRRFVPPIQPPWPGPLISWAYSDPISRKSKSLETDPGKGTGLWSYRRIADKSQFVEGTYPGDISLVNWPQNDYMLGNLCEVSAEEAARHLARAKQLSLSLLYWLQSEAPRPDGGTGWKGIRLRPDVVGTEDGLAKYPYIRESRRIRAEFTVTEQHVSTELRMKETSTKREDVKAAEFKDSVGIGSYRIDLHPSTGGNNSIDISSLPFQIPLGALLPQRVENLMPACKNLGVTHITNGCYRLHPVEWNIGEAVGVLAAFCMTKKRIPREVRKQGTLLKEYQNLLTEQGVPLVWPKVGPR